MEIKAKIRSIADDYRNRLKVITLETPNLDVVGSFQDKMKNDTSYRVNVVQWRDKRSGEANRMLWACLGEIAKSQDPPLDVWCVYLLMLKRYGKYTHIAIREDALEDLRKQWREIEVVGDLKVNGVKALDVLCFYGSSTYNTKEFSVLLNGVISEMEEMNIETPMSEDIRRALEQYEKEYSSRFE